ncbi:patatin-like phospholipase family protein [Noviherbaspirillum galbum]|uniref:Patatin family protein n=1 Tax=Noviherbaspirillum galbum TaxID=2709383 RepID=A0A6B3SLV5_9BURK|nr:patatin-like phospholipase family protein [Noviherbaspirillum galbum]NEX61814.1 patatin family protein [Noviherbaspirillum galbum]
MAASRSYTSAAVAQRTPRIGIALAGGGPLGAMYEIGALAALQEAVEGLDLNQADVYVGISAGGLIAAGLANGITPHEMCRMFIESDVDSAGEEHFDPAMLLRPAWDEFAIRGAALPVLLAEALVHYVRRRGRTSAAQSLERLKAVLPNGIFSSAGIEHFVRRIFSAPGRTNDFRKLQKDLVIVATDLDTGESVPFGRSGYSHVPISRAAQASAAVPGLFPPVEIDGNYYVDGALRKTLHASIALERGVDLLICLNPLVPYRARPAHPSGKVAQGGLPSVLSQTLRAIIHSRVEIGMANYSVTYPGTDILLVEPNQRDADMFFTNLFSYNNRRRLCESAYQNTRMMLWEQRRPLQETLAAHGLRLRLPVLRDTSLTLVKSPRKEDLFGLSALEDSLDALERHLKIAAG